VARIARAIGGRIGFDPEQAYVIGLLHDIGKIALLGLLEREMGHASMMSPALVGRAFHSSHQRAGRAMALAWKLPEELVSIAGQHHDFAANTEHPARRWPSRSPADLFVARRGGLSHALRSPAFDQLGVASSVRWRCRPARGAMENAMNPRRRGGVASRASCGCSGCGVQCAAREPGLRWRTTMPSGTMSGSR
jgi:putative nucleotidyltransferase with HDIG domain